MKTKLLVTFALLLLAPMAYGQDRKPRPLEPIRVSLVQEENPRGAESGKLFRRELNKLRDVTVVTKNPDFDLFIATLPLTEGGQCSGFVAATLVVDRSTGRHKLTIHTGADLQGIAKMATERIDRQFFQQLRQDRRK